MKNKNLILKDNYWQKLEKSKGYPKSFRKLKTILFKELKNKFNNEKFTNKIITDLYDGDFYIIRGAIKKKYIENLKKNLTKYSAKKKSQFFQIKNNCPNFWRRQDEKIAKKYSVFAVRDSYYFFRWNKEKLKIWNNFNDVWRKIKYLGGLNPKDFEKNIPSDKVIDRVQIVRYPENTGMIEPHSHDPKNQRIIISVYMSEIGVDYLSGGTVFYKKNNKKIEVEKKIKTGDVGIFYGTLKHAVEPVKLLKISKSKNYNQGRWWCGLYSPESDHNKNRKTSRPEK